MGRRLHSYHHVRTDCLTHFDRLARYVSGRSVGWVCGGGGARGLAHYGVARALHEMSLPIDYVGGTSQGAFMAALFASLHTVNEGELQSMGKRTHSMAEKIGSILTLLSDATLPFMSYFSGARFSSSIESLLGAHVRIEDLWIKFFCISVNVTRADIVVHTSGRLWQAVRSSMTILSYLPPMQIAPDQTDLLIDGGYIDNLPCGIMRELYEPFVVVASDVENKVDVRLANLTYYGASLSGVWLIYQRAMALFSCRTIKLPSFGEVLMSMMYLQHNRNCRSLVDGDMIDLYIRPNLGDTQLLDYGKEGDIVDAGYRAAKAKLTEWMIINSTNGIPQSVNNHSGNIKDGNSRTLTLSDLSLARSFTQTFPQAADVKYSSTAARAISSIRALFVHVERDQTIQRRVLGATRDTQKAPFTPPPHEESMRRSLSSAELNSN